MRYWYGRSGVIPGASMKYWVKPARPRRRRPGPLRGPAPWWTFRMYPASMIADMWLRRVEFDLM